MTTSRTNDYRASTAQVELRLIQERLLEIQERVLLKQQGFFATDDQRVGSEPFLPSNDTFESTKGSMKKLQSLPKGISTDNEKSL